MPNLQDSIVSIWKGEINKGNAKGCGFCIAPKLVLTAWHVVKDFAVKEIYLGLIPSTDKGGRVNKISRIEDYDAAIIELLQPHGKHIIECGYIDTIGDIPSIKLVAYHVDQGVIINPLEKQIANINQDQKHWHFDNYPAKGMSGGAVIYQGKAIGIIRAQSKENNDGVLLPLHLFEKEIKAILPNDNSVSLGSKTTYKQVLQNNDYLKTQYNGLLKLLKNLKIENKSQKLYQALSQDFLKTDDASEESIRTELLEKLNDDPENLVESLWICCEPHVNGLQIEIESLLLLLLAQIIDKEQWLHSSLHELNVRTRLLSELMMAARYGIPPSLSKDEKSNDVGGKYLITEDLAVKEEGINPKCYAEQVAELLSLKIYKYLADKKLIASELFYPDMDDEEQEEEWAGINVAIRARRKGLKPEFHRVEIHTKKSEGHQLLDPEVCEALHKLLPDLPITHFGKKGFKGEKTLDSQVSIFYDMLYPKT